MKKDTHHNEPQQQSQISLFENIGEQLEIILDVPKVTEENNDKKKLPLELPQQKEPIIVHKDNMDKETLLSLQKIQEELPKNREHIDFTSFEDQVIALYISCENDLTREIVKQCYQEWFRFVFPKPNVPLAQELHRLFEEARKLYYDKNKPDYHRAYFYCVLTIDFFADLSRSDQVLFHNKDLQLRTLRRLVRLCQHMAVNKECGEKKLLLLRANQFAEQIMRVKGAETFTSDEIPVIPQWHQLRLFSALEEVNDNHLYFYFKENDTIWYATKLKGAMKPIESALLGDEELPKELILKLKEAIRNQNFEEISGEDKERIIKMTTERGHTHSEIGKELQRIEKSLLALQHVAIEGPLSEKKVLFQENELFGSPLFFKNIYEKYDDEYFHCDVESFFLHGEWLQLQCKLLIVEEAVIFVEKIFDQLEFRGVPEYRYKNYQRWMIKEFIQEFHCQREHWWPKIKSWDLLPILQSAVETYVFGQLQQQTGSPFYKVAEKNFSKSAIINQLQIEAGSLKESIVQCEQKQKKIFLNNTTSNSKSKKTTVYLSQNGRALDASNSGLKSRTCTLLTLPQVSQTTEWDLANNGLTQKDIKSLAGWIESKPGPMINSLILDHNKIGSASSVFAVLGGELLLPGITNQPHLKKLSLVSCDLEGGDLEGIVQGLVASRCHLEELNVANNSDLRLSNYWGVYNWIVRCPTLCEFKVVGTGLPGWFQRSDKKEQPINQILERRRLDKKNKNKLKIEYSKKIEQEKIIQQSTVTIFQENEKREEITDSISISFSAKKSNAFRDIYQSIPSSFLEESKISIYLRCDVTSFYYHGCWLRGQIDLFLAKEQKKSIAVVVNEESNLLLGEEKENLVEIEKRFCILIESWDLPLLLQPAIKAYFNEQLNKGPEFHKTELLDEKIEQLEKSIEECEREHEKYLLTKEKQEKEEKAKEIQISETTVCFSHCELGDLAADFLRLPQVALMTTWDFSYNCLTPIAVSEMVCWMISGNKPSVKTLILDHNDLGAVKDPQQVSAKILIEVLNHNVLNKLSLVSCNLADGDIVYWEKCAKENTSLEIMDLGQNPALTKKSVVYFKEWSKKNKNLLLLDFSQTALEKEKIISDEINSYGQTTLHCAVKAGKLARVKLCIAQKANIHQRDNEGYTPWLLAIKYGHFEIAKYLQSQGASPLDCNNEKQNAVHLVISFQYNWDYFLQSELLTEEQQTKLMKQVDQDGKSILHYAVIRGNLKMIQQFAKDHPEFIDQPTQYGQTPLLFAVMYKQSQEVIQFLLKECADPSCMTISGYNALHLAQNQNNPELVAGLLLLIFTAYQLPPSVHKELLVLGNLYHQPEQWEKQVRKFIMEDHPELLQPIEELNHNEAILLLYLLLEWSECFIFKADQAFQAWEKAGQEKKEQRWSSYNGEANKALKRTAGLLAFYRQVKELKIPLAPQFQARIEAQKLRLLLSLKQQSTLEIPDFDLTKLMEILQDCYQQLLKHREKYYQWANQPLPKLAISENMPQVSRLNFAQRAEANRQFFIKFTAKLFHLALKITGIELPSYVVLGLGSMSKGEMSLYSDVEYAVLVEELSPQVEKKISVVCRWFNYFVTLMGETEDFESLNIKNTSTLYIYQKEAYNIDKGGNQALGKEGFINTPAGLVQTMEKAEVLTKTVLWSVCKITGDARLLRTYQQELNKAMHRNLDLGKRWHQIQGIESLYDNLDAFNIGKKGQKAIIESIELTFNVKQNLLRLPSQLVGDLCLFYGVIAEHMSTWDRLGALYQIGVISKTNYAYLYYLLNVAIQLRFRTQGFYGYEHEEIYSENTLEKGKVLCVDGSLKPILIECFRILLPLYDLGKQFYEAVKNAPTSKPKIFCEQICYQEKVVWIEVQAYENLFSPVEAARHYVQALQMNPQNIPLRIQHLHFLVAQRDLSPRKRPLEKEKELKEQIEKCDVFVKQLVEILVTHQTVDLPYQKAYQQLPIQCRQVFMEELKKYAEHSTRNYLPPIIELLSQVDTLKIRLPLHKLTSRSTTEKQEGSQHKETSGLSAPLLTRSSLSLKHEDNEKNKEEKEEIVLSHSETGEVNLQNRNYVRHQVSGDGDCGYTAFGIERKQAYQFLLENIDQPQVQEKISLAVYTVLKENDFVEYLKDKELLDPLWTRQAQSEEKTDEYLRNLSQNIEVMKAYLNFDVQEKRVENGWSHPLVLQALAAIRKIKISMWKLDENGKPVPHRPSKDEDYAVYAPQDHEEELDLLFVNRNHFERLEWLNAPQENRSLFSNMTRPQKSLPQMSMPLKNLAKEKQEKEELFFKKENPLSSTTAPIEQDKNKKPNKKIEPQGELQTVEQLKELVNKLTVTNSDQKEEIRKQKEQLELRDQEFENQKKEIESLKLQLKNYEQNKQPPINEQPNFQQENIDQNDRMPNVNLGHNQQHMFAMRSPRNNMQDGFDNQGEHNQHNSEEVNSDEILGNENN